MTSPRYAAKMASDAQLNFIATLLTQRTVPAELIEGINEAMADAEFTSAAASLTINTLKAMPWAQRTPSRTPVAAPVTEAGMYRNAEGTVYRVQPARGTGKLYAKELILDGEGKAHFEYAAGAVYRLTAADLMSSEQRSEFGHEFGVCCTCGRTLTDPSSIELGQGPICAAK